MNRVPQGQSASAAPLVLDDQQLDLLVSLGTSNVVMAIEFLRGSLTEDEWALITDQLEEALSATLRGLRLPAARSEALPSGRPRRFRRE